MPFQKVNDVSSTKYLAQFDCLNSSAVRASLSFNVETYLLYLYKFSGIGELTIDLVPLNMHDAIAGFVPT